MASLTVEKLDDCKVGDTPTFSVILARQLAGFNWSGIIYDMAVTADQAPTSNATALASTTGQVLTINSDGTATANMTLSQAQANNMTANSSYTAELQLRDGTHTSTVWTGKFKAVQQYVFSS